ncbi:hypothetical protein DYB28_004379 [Aphanomyces astaci]|uniref:Uncharacterized protein n=3 Tax=Aphanomyces astaci TaxID=112090 RepID=A0A9X8E462_APHAT|nr:hypothetical protein DYB28_004379 [Aphanomyces astaci]
MKVVTTLLMAALAVASHEPSDSGATEWKSKGSSEDYIAKLNDDTDEFVTSLAQWISDATEINFSIDSSFTLHTEGAEWSKSCGDLSVHSAFKVLKSFIEHPTDATKDIKKAEPLQWRPDDDCVDKREYVFLDGGAHAEFKVLCGRALLVDAIAGGGGFFVPLSRGKDKYAGGALASVDIERHQIQVAGSIRSGKRFHGGLFENNVANAFKVLADLKSTTQACATNGTLKVVGVAGGGWTQKYIKKHGGVVTSVVGYAESFSILPEGAVDIADNPIAEPITDAPAPTPVVTAPAPTSNQPDLEEVTPEPTTGALDVADYQAEANATNATEVIAAPTTTRAADHIADNSTSNNTTDIIVAPTHDNLADNSTTTNNTTDVIVAPTHDNLADNSTTTSNTTDVIVAPTVDNLADNSTTTSNTTDVIVAPTVDNLADNSTTSSNTTDVIVAPTVDNLADNSTTSSNTTDVIVAPTVDNLADNSTTSSNTTGVIVVPTTTTNQPDLEEDTPEPTTGAVDVADYLAESNFTNTTDVIVAPTPSTTVDNLAKTSKSPALTPDARTTANVTTGDAVIVLAANNAVDMTGGSSLMTLSRHVSKAYLDAGIECAASNPSSVCQAKRLAAKLNNPMQRINYATVDMTAVYDHTTPSYWNGVEIESSSAAALVAAAVLVFAVLRTQRRRSGYVGIPQANGGTNEASASALNWPWYSSST